MTELWKIRADGSGRQRVFVTEKLEGYWRTSLMFLSLSHDGRMLAFIQDIHEAGFMAHQSTSLWVMSTDSLSPKELVGKIDVLPGTANWSDRDLDTFLSKTRPIFPAWSPDDALIAFVDAVDYYGTWMVCLLNMDNAQWRKLGEGEIFAWSPDGSSVAVYSASRHDHTNELKILNLDGTVKSTVKLPPFSVLMNIDWSMLTGLIAVQGRDAQDQSQFSIFIIDPEDESQELVVEDSYEGYRPRWSPNGEMISFERTTPDYGSRRLLVLDLDNGEVRRIISKVGWESIWSPDSKYMLVQSAIEGNGLYIVSVSDGQYWKIPNTDSVDSGGSLAWSFPRE